MNKINNNENIYSKFYRFIKIIKINTFLIRKIFIYKK